jgi:Ca-activated chloride channel family protein
LTTVADQERIQRVVVLSDGRANVGVRDVSGFRALASICRERGISVSTIGLGTGYNEQVLSALAFDANGLHHFVADAADLPKVFEREESTLRATVASDVRTDIELGPGVQLVQVFGRKFRQHGQRVSVDVGPIAAGSARTVLLEVRVPGSLGETSIAKAGIAFRDTAAGADQALSRELTTQVGDASSQMDGLVAMRLERARTGAALREASALFEQGRQREALERLDRRVSTLQPQTRSLPTRARARGDRRANDIHDDLNKQVSTAKRARRRFEQANPYSDGGRRAVKSAAPESFASDL